MQEELHSACVSCEYNGIELNALKCKVMEITRAHKNNKNNEFLQSTYETGGIILGRVENERLLGVHTSKDLRWNHHTEVSSKKAVQILGFAQRNLKGCTPRVKKMAYLTMVKPILFYGTPAWHPNNTNITNIEKVQSRALKLIHGRSAPIKNQKKIMPVEMELHYH
jgi:hypothetical protein